MAIPIPSMILKQLYTFGSLKNLPDGVKFSLKNRLSDATRDGVTARQARRSDCASHIGERSGWTMTSC